MAWVPGLWLALGCALCGRAEVAGAGDASGPVHGPWPAPGHSLHGEAYNEGPRRAAVRLEGMPRVHFPVTSGNPAVQAFFDQGVGQLHGFWYFEAERSFRQVAHLDPDCAMAYWGMAMANVNQPARAREFIERAVALKGHAGDREGRWIDALARYRAAGEGEEARPETERRRDYVRDLEALVQDDPEDVEARAFLVYQIWDNAGFRNERALAMSSHQAVDALLDGVFARVPDHPAHHYRIHLWDNEKPERALRSAALGGASGPGIAHLWHMPGHTYDKLHRYGDAAWQQEASARVDHAQMRRARIPAYRIHNYAHNQEWLCRSLGQLGRVAEAVEVARNLASLPRHPERNHPGKGGSAAAYGRLRLMETLLRWEQWDALIKEIEGGHLAATGQRDQDAMRALARGLAHWMKSGDAGALSADLEALERLRGEVSADRARSAEEAEAKARRENLDREGIGRAMTEAMLAYEREIVPLEEALAELRGWRAVADGDRESAREHFTRAKRMPPTRRAMAWARLGDWDEAASAAGEGIEKSGHSLHERAVRCEVMWRSGRLEEAREAFEAVRDVAGMADPDLPILRRLGELGRELGFDGDWRRPVPVSGDVGERPDLETLGPRHWEPHPVPGWGFTRYDGSRLTSGELAGRAYLMIFYLGHGCYHCIEQLKAFGPLTGEFASVGVEVMAVSLDPPGELAWTGQRAGVEGKTPFTVVSDATMEGFRAFGAYDDFEEMALHGTFLVDGEGRVRWQDIGAEPFMDGAFLVREARRLLGGGMGRPGDGHERAGRKDGDGLEAVWADRGAAR